MADSNRGKRRVGKAAKRHSRPKDGVASLAYAHVFLPRKIAWARRFAPWPTLRAAA